MNVPEENRMWPLASDKTLLDALPRGLTFTPPDVLFKKIEDGDVAAWSGQFGGAPD